MTMGDYEISSACDALLGNYEFSQNVSTIRRFDTQKMNTPPVTIPSSAFFAECSVPIFLTGPDEYGQCHREDQWAKTQE